MKPETDIKIFIPHTGASEPRNPEPASESEQEVLAVWQPASASGTQNPQEIQ